MHTPVRNPAKGQKNPTANGLLQRQNGDAGTSRIIDNRPGSIAQRRLKEVMQNSPHLRQVSQLQVLADKSPIMPTAQKRARKNGYNAIGKETGPTGIKSRPTTRFHKVSHPHDNSGSYQGAPIQRDIGFEYETTADTYMAGAPLTPAELAALNVPGHAIVLPKGFVLINNMDGLHAKADEGGVIGSNLELETDPFPETPQGRQDLHLALKNLERFCKLIDARRATVPQINASRLAAAFGGAATAGSLYIRAAGDIDGNPQATAGILLNRIEELMERTVGGPTAGPHAPGPGSPIDRLELGFQNIGDFRTVGNAPGLVRQGIANYVLAYAGPPLPAGFPRDGLVGLCALLLSYIQRGTLGQMYAKQIAPLMARTDFGSIFNQDVSPMERAHLSAGAGAEFIAMWTNIINHAAVPGGIGGQLFAMEPHAVAGLGLAISGSLTRQAWLTGISQGNDLLTPTTFPSAAARPQLFGLGEKGAQHDIVDPTGANVPAPIFELRRMAQHVPPHTFTEIAMGAFDYIVALNSGLANPAYARAARPEKDPKRAQRRRFDNP